MTFHVLQYGNSPILTRFREGTGNGGWLAEAAAVVEVSRHSRLDWALDLLSPRVHAATLHSGLRLLRALLRQPPILTRFREGTGNGGWLAEAAAVVEVSRHSRLDWALGLLSPRVHAATLHSGLRLLRALLRQPPILTRFREGTGNGGWLAEAAAVVEVSRHSRLDWALGLLSPRVHAATLHSGLRLLRALLRQPPILTRFREGTGNGGWLAEAAAVVEVSRHSRLDWALGLLSPRVHAATLHSGLRLLRALLRQPPILTRFREGTGNGGWLAEAAAVVEGRAGTVLGFSVSAHGAGLPTSVDLNPEVAGTPGFVALAHLLPSHAWNPDAYLALLSLLVGQPAKEVGHVTSLSLEGVWGGVLGLPPSHSVSDAVAAVTLCTDALNPLLALLRTCFLAYDGSGGPSWSRSFPQTILHFLTFLYHNVAEFTAHCATEEFVVGLMNTLIREAPGMENSLEFGENFVNLSVPTQPNSPDSTPTVIEHPCRKALVEFLKCILVDSLTGSIGNGSATPLIDILLELMPEQNNRREGARLATEVLSATMEHLLAADVLLTGSSATFPQGGGNARATDTAALTANLFYFASRLVDSLWNGLYVGEASGVFEFLLKLLSQAKRKTTTPTEPLLHSLNRCVLHLLCKPLDSLQVQLGVLESLGKVTTHRSVIFSPGNNDGEFLACLAHLLFMLSVRPDIHIKEKESAGALSVEQRRFQEGRGLVEVAAKRVWEELYLSKKEVLEERLRITFLPEITAARALCSEACNAEWQSFVDSELRGPSRDLAAIHAALQSKIQKVASGLSRLASRKSGLVGRATSAVGAATGAASTTTSMASTALSRSTSTPAAATAAGQTIRLWMGVHVSVMGELLRLQAAQYAQWHEHATSFCLSQWRQIERELTRERGLWGPKTGAGKLEKWKLDTTEGPCRMRNKLVPNTTAFYIRFPYRPKLDMPEHKNLRCKVGISRDSKTYYELIKRLRGRTMDTRILDSSLSVTAAAASDDSKDAAAFLFKDMTDVNASMLRRASSQGKDSEGGDEDGDKASPQREVSVGEEGVEKDDTEDTVNEKQRTPPLEQTLPANKGPDNQTLLRLLEEGEELVSMFRCARIAGLETMEGLLLFGREHYYVVDGFTLLKTREIRDLDFLPENLHDPIVPYTATGPLPRIYSTGPRRQCAKFPYEDIREVHKRRYLLQPIALEVFSKDGRNHLLAFPKRTRNKVHAKLISVARGLEESGTSSISGQKSSAALEQSGSSSLFASFMGEASVTQRWVRGEISNFQYLMSLNTLAGRSYNDLSQYPVFPWIIADYDSEELDLNNPKSFRDLSKSMGAQTQERLEQFLKRYREWDDPTGETPPYMYGTHYSSAMIVVSYLVRLEPFTGQFLQLQGGHFDLADRMFHSIKDCWLSASKNNMADVKELIPEFFYLPEFLRNDNNYDLGVKQSGVPLGNVLLPAWAKGDTKEFVRIHREALESDYVSAHLHEWIDLIFGAKQQGQGAVEGQNLFHHLFYEGNVDFEAIHDPLTRNATIGFINNFGQIPSQLFKKPHPPKKALGGSLPRPSTGLPLSLPNSVDQSGGSRFFFHSLHSLKPPSHPIKEIRGSVGEVVMNEKGALAAVESNKVLIPPAYNKYISWGFADRSIRIASLDSDKSTCIYELSDIGEVVCAACPNSRTLVTGSTNTVVCLWELVSGGGRGRGGTPGLRLRKTLYGHSEPVTCLAASGAFGIAVSGSRDASVLVWDLAEADLVRQLGPHPSAVSAVAINPANGRIGTSSGTQLFLWTINGEPVASVNTATSQPRLDSSIIILTIGFSSLNDWDSEHVVITGSSDGVVKMWSVEYVQVPESEPVSEGATLSSPETSLSLAGKAQSLTSLSPLDPVTPELLQQRLLIQQRLHLSSLSSSSELGTTTGGCELFRWNSADMSPAEAGSPPPAGPDSGLGTPCPRSASVEQSTPASAGARRSASPDSFVFVNKDGQALGSQGNQEGWNPGRLRPGFCWRPQLLFRSKLSMHTAFDRKDNANPASITAFGTSRDERWLYVGDGKGRVWGWTGGEERGGRADHWVQDPARTACTACQQRFSVAERKHHCRNCGQIFCAKCSRFESEIRSLRISRPVRVCQNCFLRLRAETPPSK